MSRHKRNLRFKRRTLPGASPGTLIADPAAASSSVSVIGYSEADLIERRSVTVADIRQLRGTFPILWINVDGLADIDLIRQLGDLFKLHGLALEDVVNVHQRPKAEEYEDHVFIVTRMAVPGRRLETG